MTVYVVEVGGPEERPTALVSYEPVPRACPTCGHFGDGWPGALARVPLADKGEARKLGARLYQRVRLDRDGDAWRVKEG